MQHVDYSTQLVASLPEAVEKSAREPFGARCVVFALLLDPNAQVRQQQLGTLKTISDSGTSQETEHLAEQMAQLAKSARLMLIEIAQGALRQLSPEQYRQFRDAVVELIKADEKINLFEFTVQSVLLSHLDRVFGLARPHRVRYYSIRGVVEDVAALMSALAHVGHSDPDLAHITYQAAVSPLQIDHRKAALLDRSKCTLSRLKLALENLATCSMPIKKRVLGAATLCVAADGTVTVGEAELLRRHRRSPRLPHPTDPAWPSQKREPDLRGRGHFSRRDTQIG